MVAHLAIIFRGYQNLLDKNVFFLKKNSKLTKIQWSPSYDENSAEGFNKWPGRSVLHNRTGLSTIRTCIKTGSKILRTGTVAKF